MKKILCLVLIAVLIGIFATAQCVGTAKEDRAGYLIITNHCCIIVRSPAKQLTSSIGQANLGIILKDRTTRVEIYGGYLSIRIPLSKMGAAIKKYRLQNLIVIE